MINQTHKVAVITGGSRGIGAATAQLLAQQGFRIAINFRSNNKAATEVAKAIQARGGEAACFAADVSQEESVVNLFEAVDQHFGRLDALVNNAGILLPQATLLDCSAKRLEQLFAANTFSAFYCCREAVKRMSTRFGGQGGNIVNVSSAAARIGSAGEYIDYAASKGAMDTLTIGLANEVADQGIRVNSVRPGFIDTEMHADGGEPNRIERIKSAIPLKRGGQAQEVAEAIAFLVSKKSSYTTGSFIEVAGGR